MFTFFNQREAMTVRLLRGLVFCLFVGRAWQHLRWDAPLRELLWRESLMKPIVALCGWPWEQWVGSLSVDSGIQLTIRIMGVVYLCCGLAALVVRAEHKSLRLLLGFGTAQLVFLSFLYYLEQFFRVGQFIEYALQIGSPLFLLAALDGRLQTARWQMAIKVAIALTFLGHGLYAAGYYPTPGPFVTMVMKGFMVGEDSARIILKVAGYLDIALVIGLFLPRGGRMVMGYTVIWGFATTFARLVATAETPTLVDWINTWWHECLIRLVHGGIPLLMLLWSAQKDSQRGETPVALGTAAPSLVT